MKTTERINPKAGLNIHTMLVQELPAEMRTKPINNPETLYAMMKSILASDDEINQDKEHFWAIGLNTQLYINPTTILGEINT